jgi:hypothetical protein
MIQSATTPEEKILRLDRQVLAKILPPVPQDFTLPAPATGCSERGKPSPCRIRG